MNIDEGSVSIYEMLGNAEQKCLIVDLNVGQHQDLNSKQCPNHSWETAPRK
jgi:hypothetical protein